MAKNIFWKITITSLNNEGPSTLKEYTLDAFIIYRHTVLFYRCGVIGVQNVS